MTVEKLKVRFEEDREIGASGIVARNASGVAICYQAHQGFESEIAAAREHERAAKKLSYGLVLGDSIPCHFSEAEKIEAASELAAAAEAGIAAAALFEKIESEKTALSQELEISYELSLCQKTRCKKAVYDVPKGWLRGGLR